MNEEQRKRLSQLLDEMTARNVVLTADDESAIFAADAELVRLRAENEALRITDNGCEVCRGGCPDKDHHVTHYLCDECWDHSMVRPIKLLQEENVRLRAIEKRCEDAEGVAKVLFKAIGEHCDSQEDRWAKDLSELNARGRRMWNEVARAVRDYLLKGEG